MLNIFGNFFFRGKPHKIFVQNANMVDVSIFCCCCSSAKSFVEEMFFFVVKIEKISQHLGGAKATVLNCIGVVLIDHQKVSAENGLRMCVWFRVAFSYKSPIIMMMCRGVVGNCVARFLSR